MKLKITDWNTKKYSWIRRLVCSISVLITCLIVCQNFWHTLWDIV